MKKTLHPFSLLLALLMLLFAGQAHATHYQGGQLTYRSLGPDPATPANTRYEVNLQIFRDCGGATLDSSYPLVVRQGCQGTTLTGSPFTMTRVGNSSFGNPYCPSQAASAPCSSTGSQPTGSKTNYEVALYRTIISVPPAAEWTLSSEPSARPSIANIDGNTTLRFEATLNNRLALPGGQFQNIENNSPRYLPQDVPIPFVCFKQQTTITFSALEADGDSLAYSLSNPLKSCGGSNIYQPFSANGFIELPDSAGQPCAAIVRPSTGTYSPTFPLPSYQVTGRCPLKVARPYFEFNAATGSFTFIPSIYDATSDESEGKNKYAVVGKVTEYRKINGTWYKVGSVRRDMLVVIIDCGQNTVPNPPVISAPTVLGNVSFVNSRDSTYIEVPACNYNRILLTFSDPNPGQQLTVFRPNVDSLLQYGSIGTFTLANNGGTTPRLVFQFQPSPFYIGQVIRMPFRVEDNACPAKASQSRIVVVKIVAGNYARALAGVSSPGLPGGLSTDPPTICPGGTIQLEGRVSRPDSVRGGLQVYRYTWSGGNINPADVNKAQITVNPTVTTTYSLRIEPTIGFQQGACSDVTTITVRVAPEPTASIATNKTEVCPGEAVSLTASARRGDNLQDTYTYQWQPANGLAAADLNKPNPVVRPTQTTTYQVRVNGQSPYGCDATTSVEIKVTPAAVAAFTVDSAAAPGSRFNRPPRLFTFTNRSTIGGIISPNNVDSLRWSYQRVKDETGAPISGEPEVIFYRRKGANGPTPSVPLTLTTPGTYIIRLRITEGALSGTQCAESVALRTVTVPRLDVPNVFTPNQDGLNDTFIVQAEQVGNKMEIYNRWGRKVKEYANYNNDWNGDDQPSGLYYYVITDRNGKSSKGWVEMIR
ncbi:gliding motility-associated C-terminal domain-containing protein [Hymenobacter busanensis]|uniref:Gliding motility-associated C-terminal domain-containing protein n=1 Tax=Hymenobacter busanensis TaxID=2607656 RepID=A0A7L5A415_9BACT|nr:gliding motility-associated C-terminal domain-containing protein [Hymenobacter busanensis]KAA9331629.1 gliding motility-associated C-terminal domain-containing protein [Hymenobacter busanensis]QHJ08780.1 T9SS type B sorting domain-containing protein [Hymenobacter busanensis]